MHASTQLYTVLVPEAEGSAEEKLCHCVIYCSDRSTSCKTATKAMGQEPAGKAGAGSRLREGQPAPNQHQSCLLWAPGHKAFTQKCHFTHPQPAGQGHRAAPLCVGSTALSCSSAPAVPALFCWLISQPCALLVCQLWFLPCAQAWLKTFGYSQKLIKYHWKGPPGLLFHQDLALLSAKGKSSSQAGTIRARMRAPAHHTANSGWGVMCHMPPKPAFAYRKYLAILTATFRHKYHHQPSTTS